VSNGNNLVSKISEVQTLMYCVITWIERRRMRERDRLSLRQFREEYAAEEAAKQAESDRPLREAEAQYQETSKAIANARRERLVRGLDLDLEEYVPDEKLTELEALVQGERETEFFLIFNQWFYPCPENSRLLMDYVARNGRSRSITRELLETVATKMRDYGLLKERPAEPTPATAQTDMHFHSETIEPSIAERPKSETFLGWDVATGQQKEYSTLEVNRMSGDQYMRAFRLNRSGMLLAGRGVTGQR
jgi:hypothetical protein